MSSSIRFTAVALAEFKKIAIQYKKISDHLCRMVIYEQISYEEPVLVEISRIGINSYIFEEYLDKIMGFIDPGPDGLVELNDDELANIYKCIKALSDSKLKLLESSISVELH